MSMKVSKNIRKIWGIRWYRSERSFELIDVRSIDSTNVRLSILILNYWNLQQPKEIIECWQSFGHDFIKLIFCEVSSAKHRTKKTLELSMTSFPMVFIASASLDFWIHSRLSKWCQKLKWMFLFWIHHLSLHWSRIFKNQIPNKKIVAPV